MPVRIALPGASARTRPDEASRIATSGFELDQLAARSGSVSVPALVSAVIVGTIHQYHVGQRSSGPLAGFTDQPLTVSPSSKCEEISTGERTTSLIRRLSNTAWA